MRTGYVAAIDQGTTGTRSVVVDGAGRFVGSAYRRHEQYYPHPGWVEHDPEELWENTKAACRAALADGDVDAESLEAIGVTNQRETTVVWDADTGEPVDRAIVWQDRRTTERIEALDDKTVEYIHETTGLQPDAYFSASKLEWLLEEHGSDGLRFGTVDSWLVSRLTGRHVTDVTNASRTMLFDIHSGTWDERLLEEFSVPERVLPTVVPSSSATAFGSTSQNGFLGASVPVAGVLGDQQAALFGQTCFEPGEAKNTYGTGCFLLLHTGQEATTSDHGLLTTIAFQADGGPIEYALEGSIFATGAAIEWLVDAGLVDDAAETEALAVSVDSTDDVFFVPAFSGLGAPHWDGRARGTLVGLTRGTTKAHIVRAALEAIAYRTRDVVEAMVDDSGIEMRSLRVDGGAVKNDVLCQIQADVLQTELERPVIDETTALGAAYAAGLAVDHWESRAELRSLARTDRRFTPDATDEYDAKYDRWGQAVERAKGWAVDENQNG